LAAGRSDAVAQGEVKKKCATDASAALAFVAQVAIVAMRPPHVLRSIYPGFEGEFGYV
jgi:hypothetical protein